MSISIFMLFFVKCFALITLKHYNKFVYLNYQNNDWNLYTKAANKKLKLQKYLKPR